MVKSVRRWLLQGGSDSCGDGGAAASTGEVNVPRERGMLYDLSGFETVVGVGEVRIESGGPEVVRGGTGKPPEAQWRSRPGRRRFPGDTEGCRAKRTTRRVRLQRIRRVNEKQKKRVQRQDEDDRLEVPDGMDVLW